MCWSVVEASSALARLLSGLLPLSVTFVIVGKELRVPEFWALMLGDNIIQKTSFHAASCPSRLNSSKSLQTLVHPCLCVCMPTCHVTEVHHVGQGVELRLSDVVPGALPTEPPLKRSRCLEGQNKADPERSLQEPA